MQRVLTTIYGGPVQTTDATVTTLASYDLSDPLVSPSGVAWNNCSVTAMAFAGGKTAAGNSVSGNGRAGFKRIAGTISQVGVTLGDLFVDATLVGSGITIDFSGNLIRLRINGIVGQTVDWLGYLQLFLAEP